MRRKSLCSTRGGNRKVSNSYGKRNSSSAHSGRSEREPLQCQSFTASPIQQRCKIKARFGNPKSCPEPPGAQHAPPHDGLVQILGGLCARYEAAIPGQIVRPVKAPGAEPGYETRLFELQRIEPAAGLCGIGRGFGQRQRNCRKISGAGYLATI